MKPFKKLISTLLALSLLFTLAACGSQNSDIDDQSQPSEPVTDSFTPYTFVDDLGHEIEITEKLTGIVPSGPLAQVILLGIAPDLIVGLGSKMSDNMAEYLPDYDRLSQLTYFGTVLGAEDLMKRNWLPLRN